MVRRSWLVLTLVVAVLGFGATFPAARAPGPQEWRLPLEGGSVVAPFRAPAHEYGPGHRGVDLAPTRSTDAVVAAADGTVLFAGTVVDRGVITIDHGDGWMTSVEPVAPTVEVGTVVRGGDPIGTIAAGGHAASGTLHVGVRHHGMYVNPLALLGRVPRAVLLPCC